MEVNPLSVILVKSDSKGDRLLFRYPYETDVAADQHDPNNGKRNPYALGVIEDLLQTPMPQTSNIHKGHLTGFTDEVLSTLFAVKPELCNRKFELKVNDVRFVGHPTHLPFRMNNDDGLINIVFALQALASHSIVKCYYDLSKRLGNALRYEERKCAFLSKEMKIMIGIHDELSSMDSDNEDHNTSDFCTQLENPRSAFHQILQKSSLANTLKTVFEELTNSGIVQARINDWVLISFCLPHKAHQFHNRGLIIEPETIDRCLRSLRPYHGMLLLVDPNELLDSIPLDSSPSLIRLIMQYSPLKSLQTLAIETDLPLSQIFQLTGHLVYWAKATIIYPLCESNVYVIAPHAQVHLHSPLVEKFAEDFPGLCLIQVMSMLSLPAPLWYPARTWAGGAGLLARCIVWMLQRHLLLQLHTYIQFLPTLNGPPINGMKDYYCEKHNGRRPTLSDSLVSLNLLPQTSVTTPSSDNSGDDSLVLCGADNREWIFPSNICKISSENTFNRKEDKNSHSAKINKHNEQQQSINGDKSKVENPKSVFRENNFNFGDINLEFPTNGLDEKYDGIQFDVPKTNGGEIEKNHLNGKIVNGSKSRFQEKCPSFDANNMLIDAELNNNTKKNNNSNHEIFLSKNDNESNKDVEPFSKIVNGVDASKCDDNSKNIMQDKEKALNTTNSHSGNTISEKKNSFYRLSSDSSFQSTNASHFNSTDVVDAPNISNRNSCTSITNGSSEPLSNEMLLAEFTEEEKIALLKIPAAHNPDDFNLMATLYKKGYFRGEQHLEEIMFMENLTRSQVLQLLDKFRDVLITYETEDPAIAMLYSN